MTEASEVTGLEPQGEPQGVYAAALTPLKDDLSPDKAAMARHCRWLAGNGCDGVAVLGTTGEANSLSVDERLAILEALIEAGIPGDKLIPGTGCCALTDTVRLTRQAIELGICAVLVLPPFYYKNVSDEGLFAAYSEVIERVGDRRLRLYFYHFPQISAVPLSIELIERLLKAYPGTVAGIKDSSGDLENMTSLARGFPGFRVFAGTEKLLLPLLKAGGVGCISAGANVLSALIGRLYGLWREKKGDAKTEGMQEEVTAKRLLLERFPMIPAMKQILARHTGKASWANVRPPLVRLAPDEAAELFATLDGAGLTL
ncbi:MAG: dihydrodipicolinate synthase family protein [Alphaproteobacteria bacterium]